MNLDEIKQKRVAAAQFEASQREERAKSEKKSDVKRAEFSQKNEQEQVMGAIEQLQKTQQDIRVFRSRLEISIAQVREVQATKHTNNERLEEIYGKIEEMLKDPDIQAEFSNLGKNIIAAEDLVADADFKDDPGVEEALKIKIALSEVEKELKRLESDERKLHGEIQKHLGIEGKKTSGEIATDRQELQKLLEDQIKVIDEEVAVLELHTPEGAKKAEGELAKLLESNEHNWDVRGQDEIAERTMRFNPVGNRENILHFREILGEAKFLEIVTAAYRKRLDSNAASYKKNSGLDKWEKDFKAVEGYGKQIVEAEAGIKELEGRIAETGRQLEQFFLTEPGSKILEEMVKKDAEQSFRGGLSSDRGYRGGLTGEQEKDLQSKQETEVAYMRKGANLQDFARRYSGNVAHQLDVVAGDYMLNSSYNHRGAANPTTVEGVFYEQTQVARDNLREKNYGELPNMSGTVEGIKQAEVFFKSLGEKIKNPEVVEQIIDITQAAYAYVHTGKGDSSAGLRISLQQPHMNSYWYNSIGGRAKDVYKDIEEFQKILPQFDAKKIGLVKFENAGFGAKPRQQWAGETTSDQMAKQLIQVNGFVEKMRPVVAQKAEYDVSLAVIHDFEHSSKHPEVQTHEGIKKRRELITQLLPGFMAIQQAVDAKRKVLLREQTFGYEGTTIYINDSESQQLDKKANELDRQISEKTEEQARLGRQERPGMLSGKRGDWDAATALLKAEIPTLKAERESVRIARQNLKPVEEGLEKLGQLLTRVAKELPEDYKSLYLAGIEKAGQIYEKFNALAQDVASKQSSGDQREFARDYQSLQSQTNKLKSQVEQAVTNLGLYSRISL